MGRNNSNGTQYSLSEHSEEITTHVVKNLVWLPIVSLLNALINGISKVLNESTAISFWDGVTFLCTLVCMIVCVFICIQIRKSSKLTSTENDARIATPLTDFRIKSIIAEFNIESREQFTSQLDYSLIANKDGIPYFERDLLWTGEKYDGTELITKSDMSYRFQDMGGNDGYHTYRVYFDNHNIRLQDSVEFKLRTQLSDRKHTMVPYYGYTVKHQIDTLTLRLLVPEGNESLVKSVKSSVYMDEGRQIRIGESKGISKRRVGNTIVYEVKVENPTLLYRYVIDWDFTK